MGANDKRAGWDWFAFLFGPFWYLANGVIGKGVWLLVVCVLTVGLGAPFVWIFRGAKGRSDRCEYRLRNKNQYDINDL